jgi:adenylate kinase
LRIPKSEIRIMNIVFLGPPGSGKGTQAQRVAADHGLAHLSTGDIFRDAIKSKSELGQEITSYVEAGKLVPDDLVSRVVFDRLKSGPSGSGFLLDGYPRTVDQAKSLDKFSSENGIAIEAVIMFDVEFAELVKRLSARRQCPSCKEVYNVAMRPPKVADRCDKCSSELIHRPDDKAEIVQERLRVYTRQTEPILSHYEGKPFFKRINAAQPIDQVYADIDAALKSLPKAGSR